MDARTFAVGMGDPILEFERGRSLPLKGAQVVTSARQTGVDGTPRGTEIHPDEER